MVETILSSPFVRELILPFVLVFALIYVILDRTKIFGDGKAQANAIIALAVSLMFVGFSEAVGITVKLMGFMAVMAVIILVFILLFAFASGEEFKMPKQLKAVFGGIIGLALVIALLIMTGWWQFVVEFFEGGTENKFAATIAFFVIIGAAVAVVMGIKAKSS